MKKKTQARKGHTRNRRKNPAFGLGDLRSITGGLGDLFIASAVFGCSLEEKLLFGSLLQALVPYVRKVGTGKPKSVGERARFNQVHWDAFKPHCPQILGVPCPSNCKNHGQAQFDGCHVCDCLHGSDPK